MSHFTLLRKMIEFDAVKEIDRVIRESIGIPQVFELRGIIETVIAKYEFVSADASLGRGLPEDAAASNRVMLVCDLCEYVAERISQFYMTNEMKRVEAELNKNFDHVQVMKMGGQWC